MHDGVVRWLRLVGTGVERRIGRCERFRRRGIDKRR
jgi:hypothetical protein